MTELAAMGFGTEETGLALIFGRAAADCLASSTKEVSRTGDLTGWGGKSKEAA